MRTTVSVAVVVSFLIGGGLSVSTAAAQEAKTIALPKPQMDQSKPLLQALKDRKTTREFSDKKLSTQTLSNLLWAACGINRPESGRRTAPTALNRQEIDVYVATADGLYLYDPKGNALVTVLSKDIRESTATQPQARAGAVNLIYVANLSKMAQGSESERMMLASVDTGFIGQNVYLYCSSAGLVTVFYASVDRPKLAEIMKLKPDQKIMFAQCIGYPKAAK